MGSIRPGFTRIYCSPLHPARDSGVRCSGAGPTPSTSLASQWAVSPLSVPCSPATETYSASVWPCQALCTKLSSSPQTPGQARQDTSRLSPRMPGTQGRGQNLGEKPGLCGSKLQSSHRGPEERGGSATVRHRPHTTLNCTLSSQLCVQGPRDPPERLQTPPYLATLMRHSPFSRETTKGSGSHATDGLGSHGHLLTSHRC